MRFRAGTGAVQLAVVAAVLLAGTAWGRGPEACGQGEAVRCLSCAIFCRYGGVLDSARLEVGSIERGIVLHFAAEDPQAVVDLQRFALERKKLHGGLGDQETLAQLCDRCRRRTERIRTTRFDVANSAHGVFTILTSDDPEVVRALREMAAEMALHNDVRGS